MRKRYVVLGLSAFLALALAVPAFGGPENPVSLAAKSAKSIAQKALKKAKKAQKTANTANSTANTALTNANNAQNTANGAETDAQKALTNAATAETDAQTGITKANQAETDAQTALTNAAAANDNANTRIKDSVEEAGTSTPNNTTSPKFTSVACPTGDVVTGGGYRVGGTNPNDVTVTNNEETLYGGGWFVDATAITGTPTWSLQALAVCGTK